jgi:hypothetical protein
MMYASNKKHRLLISLELEPGAESLQQRSSSSSSSSLRRARAVSITDRNSLRDILEPLLCSSLIEDGLEPSAGAEREEGNAEDDTRSRFVDGLAKRDGNADDALRRFMDLLDSDSFLGWNDMLLEGFGL